MGYVTPSIHFGRVILSVWSSPFQSVFYATCTLDGTYVPCVFPNDTLLIQYALYIISLKTLGLPSDGDESTTQSTRQKTRVLMKGLFRGLYHT